MPEGALFNAAVIGCGNIGRTHAGAFARHPRARLVALADVRPEAAAALAGAYGVQASSCYQDAAAMLAREAVDIVAVCTWPGLHAPMVVAAAEAGVKAIICEKPFAPDLAQADEMLAACDKHGVKLIISHQHRFNPYSVEARRLIAAGAIGQPLLLHRQTVRGLLNNGSHMVDLGRYILGDPPWEWLLGQVQRDTDRYERGGRIEDVVVGLIGFAGGVRGLFEVDTPKPHEAEFKVYGSEAVLSFTTKELRLSSQEAPVALNTEGFNVHIAQLDELIAWLEGGPAHRNDAHNNRHTLEILMGIYQSARRRTIVRPPLESGPSPLELMIDSGELPVRIPGRVDLPI